LKGGRPSCGGKPVERLVVTFYRRHLRHGPLFQNRFRSFICQEDLYFKELARYIHLNPLRAGIVSDLNQLGYDLDTVEDRVCEIFGIEKGAVFSRSRVKEKADARALFCFWAARELGYGLTALGRKLRLSQPGVGYAVSRVERISKLNQYQLRK